MRSVALLLLAFAAAALLPHFEITGARGKKAAGVALEPGPPDPDGWFPLKLASSKADAVLLWPLHATAKAPDGPGAIPAIAIERGEQRALLNPAAIVAIAAPVVLGEATLEEAAQKTGLPAASLATAFAQLQTAQDPLQKGVGLLYAKQPADAAEELSRALKERQRQLTRVPSEIYPAALLSGEALLRAGKFDAAAVAFLTALRQKPSDERALEGRRNALIQAGKPEAADALPRK